MEIVELNHGPMSNALTLDDSVSFVYPSATVHFEDCKAKSLGGKHSNFLPSVRRFLRYQLPIPSHAYSSDSASIDIVLPNSTRCVRCLAANVLCVVWWRGGGRLGRRGFCTESQSTGTICILDTTMVEQMEKVSI